MTSLSNSFFDIVSTYFLCQKGQPMSVVRSVRLQIQIYSHYIIRKCCIVFRYIFTALKSISNKSCRCKWDLHFTLRTIMCMASSV